MALSQRGCWSRASLERCAALRCACCAAARRTQARVHAQNRAVVNLFRGPNLIEDVAVTMRRLEEGDLKLRVRALDSERALTRVLVRHPHARGKLPRKAADAC